MNAQHAQLGSCRSVSMNISFDVHAVLQECHRSFLFSTTFCTIVPAYYSYFATVGKHTISIYRITPSGVVLVQTYVDEDVEEKYYSCVWVCKENTKVCVAAAGEHYTVKIVNVHTFQVECVLQGHGNSINDMKCHPVSHDLLLTASRDESIRMWNINTSQCIAIFAGEGGHRDDVLHISIHPLGNCFVSGGMDGTMKVWNLVSSALQQAIDTSYSTDISQGPIKYIFDSFPLFSTPEVHDDYCDNVIWFGNAIISKSTKSRIAMWKPDQQRRPDAAMILREFHLTNMLNCWFSKMDICVPLDLLATGNTVHLFTLSDMKKQLSQRIPEKEVEKTISGERYEIGATSPSLVLKHDFRSGKPKMVREVSFSGCGKYLGACDDAGVITVWKITRSVLRSEK